MENKRKCIIWGTELQSEIKEILGKPPISGNSKYEYDSSRAGGKYLLSFEAHLMNKGKITTLNQKTKRAQELSDRKKIELSGYIAKENLNGRTPDLDKIMEDENWLEKLPPIPSPDERAYLLLEGLKTCSKHIGYTIALSNTINRNSVVTDLSFLYALSYCSNMEEFKFLIKSLKESEKIDNKFIIDIGNLKGAFGVTVTEKGWEKDQSMNELLHKHSKTVFIAMWFDDSMNDLKKEIKNGVEQAGHESFRIDEKEYNNKIDDEILSDIDQSCFVVCDLTSELGKPRGSVYFEAGYAAKSKKRNFIIWTCDEQLKDEIAFDVGRYNFIFWSKDEKGNFWTKDGDKTVPLKDKIQKRIEGIVYSNLQKEGEV